MILLPAESRQEAESHGQSLQEAFFRGRQSRQDTRDHGQSRRKPNVAESRCRKRKLADSFKPFQHVISELDKNVHMVPNF